MKRLIAANVIVVMLGLALAYAERPVNAAPVHAKNSTHTMRAAHFDPLSVPLTPPTLGMKPIRVTVKATPTKSTVRIEAPAQWVCRARMLQGRPDKPGTGEYGSVQVCDYRD